MNNYIRKIEEKLNAVENYYADIKELLLIDDIEDIDKFIDYYDTNKIDFYYHIFELELKLRALRDKLDHG